MHSYGYSFKLNLEKGILNNKDYNENLTDSVYFYTGTKVAYCNSLIYHLVTDYRDNVFLYFEIIGYAYKHFGNNHVLLIKFAIVSK